MAGYTPANPDQPSSEEETVLLEDLRVVFDRRAASADISGEQPDDLQGRRIGRYVVGDLLGEGGMARVYKALDSANEQQVALKTLKPQYRADRGLCARFEREARTMATIHHEHVVAILDFPCEGSMRAIVTEFLPGGSLRDRLNAARPPRAPLAIQEAVALILQAAAGVGAAHNVGLVHRDIKPSNLLLDAAGRIKVADFGAIMVLEGTTWLTGVGQQIGTPAYMSPEQCQGQRVTAASDVYSLGVTLFELLTDHLPFEVEEASPFAIMLKHISEPVPDPREARTEIPAGLAAVILQSLAKAPAARFPNAHAFADALLSQLAAPTELPQPEAPRPHGWRVDLAAVRKQLQLLPQRAIVCWACRCARRVQHLNPDPRVEQALAMAEATLAEPQENKEESPHSVSRALSRIRALLAASLKAAYAQETTDSPQATIEAGRAAAAAAASGAAFCTADTAADAAFAARSAIAALKLSHRPIRAFWDAARNDYHKLINAKLGREGTVGRPIPPTLFDDEP